MPVSPERFDRIVARIRRRVVGRQGVNPDPLDVPGAIDAEVAAGLMADEARTVTHQCPLNGHGFTPCCSKSIFELPRGDRMTFISSLVTCKGATHHV